MDYRYFLIDNNVFRSNLPIDEYEDGDIEADMLEDQIRILISKKDGKLFVANAMDGHSQNIRFKFDRSPVQELIPQPPAAPSVGVEEAAREWADNKVDQYSISPHDALCKAFLAGAAHVKGERKEADYDNLFNTLWNTGIGAGKMDKVMTALKSKYIIIKR